MFTLRSRTYMLRLPARTLCARFESTQPPPGPSAMGSFQVENDAPSDASISKSPADELAKQPRKWPRHPRGPPRPMLSTTHFLTIPLYQHSPELRDKISAFRENIIKCGIKGLTKDTVLPRLSYFLELRLGSLNIEGFKAHNWNQRRPPRSKPTLPMRAEKMPIPFAEVQEVLNGLKAPIQQILSANGGDGALHIPLGNLRPLLHGPRAWFNPRNVNILFLEPAGGPASDALRAVNELVFNRLQDTGLWVDSNRPSVLSMTLANSRYREGRAVRSREIGASDPFDILQLYESEAFRAVRGGPPEGEIIDFATPRPVVLGEGVARSLHLIPLREPEPEGVSEVERAQASVGDDTPPKPDFTLEF